MRMPIFRIARVSALAAGFNALAVMERKKGGRDHRPAQTSTGPMDASVLLDLLRRRRREAWLYKQLGNLIGTDDGTSRSAINVVERSARWRVSNAPCRSNGEGGAEGSYY